MEFIYNKCLTKNLSLKEKEEKRKIDVYHPLRKSPSIPFY